MPMPPRMVTYKGVTKRMDEWATELGVSRSTIAKRDKEGAPLDAPIAPGTPRTRAKPSSKPPPQHAPRHEEASRPALDGAGRRASHRVDHRPAPAPRAPGRRPRGPVAHGGGLGRVLPELRG